MADQNRKGAGRRLTILLAEADELARGVMAGSLSDRYAVTEATTVAEARERFERNRPEMAILAARLPGGGGGSLAASIRRIDRRVPLFLTGTAEDILAVLSTVSLPGIRPILRPVDPTALVEALDDAAGDLAARRSAEDAWELVKFFLDEAPHLAAILHGPEIITVNRAFLRFMGLTTLHEFKARGGSLDRYLVEPLPSGSLTAWACRLPDDQLDREHRLRLHNPDRPDQSPHVFQVAVTRLPGRDRCLLILTDVTELELERRELLDLANLDPLTRLLNRRKLQEVLTDEVARANRYQTPLSLLLLDIDHFKVINDTHGHDAGDAVLVELAGRLGKGLRQVDRLARFGGEEFVVVAPGIDLPAAVELAERLRGAVAGKEFNAAGPVTASFGVAGYAPGEQPEAMIKRADEALYRAKTGGRNKVECETSPQPSAR
jgi:two-component system, cell cycle response regulator